MSLVCGIDEAGRGCVAGSLFLACVILDSLHFEDFCRLGVKDSKTLSQSKRNHLAELIKNFLKNHNGSAKILSFDSKTIDNFGLSHCMQNGLMELLSHAKEMQCHKIIFDGNTNFGVKEIKTMIRGDGKHVLIGAASILAKECKDSEMMVEDKNYPHYDFKKNKGYLTQKHLNKIMQYGYTPIHRKSYHIKALNFGASLF